MTTTTRAPTLQHHFVRHSKRFEVHLQVRLHDAQSVVDQYALNLSEGGLFVAGPICQHG